jgi:hypothetical protein
MSDLSLRDAAAARRLPRRPRPGPSVARAPRSSLLVFLVLAAMPGRTVAEDVAKTAQTWPANSLARGASPPVTVLDYNYTFPVTAVGQTSGFCTALCFCSNVNSCTCDETGMESVVHDLAPPFSAFNYRLEAYQGGGYDCYGGTPVTLPVTVGAGQQLTFNIEFSPTSPGTFSDYLALYGFTYFLSGSTPRGEASLVPAPLAGWSAPLVVSTSPGTQTDSPNLTSTEPLYLSWSIQNQGDLATFATFFVDVNLDGALLHRWTWSAGLQPQSYADQKDYQFGPLTPGTHTLELVPDPTGVSGASSVTYQKSIVVASPGPPPEPAWSTTWYVSGRLNKRALNNWAKSAGVQAGQKNQTQGGANFVILNFGQPAQLPDGSYGASGYGRQLSAAEITNTAEQFILGYESVAHHALWLAIGTTNFQTLGTKQPTVTPAHARAWAQMLIGLETWIVSQGFRVHLAAASDAEVAWNSPAITSAWFQALAGEIAASGANIVSYDFGDAAGCPRQPGTSTSQPCPVKGSPYHWAQADIAGLNALYVPQIYNMCTAPEWEGISGYIALTTGKVGVIKGVLSEYEACTQVGGCGKGTACTGTDDMPSDAWQQMVGALGNDAAAAAGLPGLSWSTDIKWNYLP